MTKKTDSDLHEGSGGLTISQLHELVKQGVARNSPMHKPLNQLTLKQNRWQRFVRYTWDKRRG